VKISELIKHLANKRPKGLFAHVTHLISPDRLQDQRVLHCTIRHNIEVATSNYRSQQTGTSNWMSNVMALTCRNVSTILPIFSMLLGWGITCYYAHHQQFGDKTSEQDPTANLWIEQHPDYKKLRIFGHLQWSMQPQLSRRWFYHSLLNLAKLVVHSIVHQTISIPIHVAGGIASSAPA
jgi:hypothetical protein